MDDLEHPGAAMRAWWLEGTDPDSNASQLGVAPGELRLVLDGRANISPELAAQLEAGGSVYRRILGAAANRLRPRTPNRSTRRHGSIEPALP